jgi:hypothetical protein
MLNLRFIWYVRCTTGVVLIRVHISLTQSSGSPTNTDIILGADLSCLSVAFS